MAELLLLDMRHADFEMEDRDTTTPSWAGYMDNVLAVFERHAQPLF